eukprot:TRINITY_DN406_c0_g1_i1.p1 TRINITY_DN406_c0_g1~~TRINITY_DN406_c0_g1_i1.p1  ORF type:complete len:211 (-),score=29.72 TRINITY_DN406_c0_g1_i1:452-1042(-)
MASSSIASANAVLAASPLVKSGSTPLSFNRVGATVRPRAHGFAVRCVSSQESSSDVSVPAQGLNRRAMLASFSIVLAANTVVSPSEAETIPIFGIKPSRSKVPAAELVPSTPAPPPPEAAVPAPVAAPVAAPVVVEDVVASIVEVKEVVVEAVVEAASGGFDVGPLSQALLVATGELVAVAVASTVVSTVIAEPPK